MLKSIFRGLVVFLLNWIALIPQLRAEETQLGGGINRADLDTSVKPGDDFFQYVNGSWLKKNPIPAEYSRWGAFSKLRDDNLANLRKILEGLSDQNGTLEGNKRKLRDFYATAMDQAKLNEQGVKPLADEFAKIGKIKNIDDLVAELGHLSATGIPVLFHFSVDQDEKQSTRYAIQFWQGGLGLPERDYYLGDSDDSKRIRTAYQEHVAKMLELLGDSPKEAAAGAETVLTIETKLAEASRKPVDLRDREAQYNKMNLKELAELVPNVKWNAYWRAVDVQNPEDCIVGQPEFMKRVNELLSSVPIDQWKTYLRWHLIHATAPYLSEPLEKENFSFYSGVLRGVKEMQPRWKRAINAIDRQMGEALGQLYVEKYFPPAAKKRMDELVKNLMVAYRERIETRDWMGPETKKAGLSQTWHGDAEDRLSQQVARLFDARYRHRFVRAKHAASRSLRNRTDATRLASLSIATNGA